MPKVKLGEPDPRARELKAMIAAGKSRMGMTNEQLAKKIGMNERTMQDHFANLSKMHVPEMWSILDALNVPAEERKNLI